jgi:hypothetical protein
MHWHHWVHLIHAGGKLVEHMIESGKCSKCHGKAESALKCCSRKICSSCIRDMITDHGYKATFKCRFCSHSFDTFS